VPFPSHAAALAAFDMGDISKVLLILMFVVAPIANKVLGAARKKTPSRPPARRPPTQTAAGVPARPFSWEDLISGRAPERGPVANPPEERPVHAEDAGPVRDEVEAAVPESMLAGFPTENELEVTGGDKEASIFKDWEEGALATREHRSRWRPRRGEWRRALVLSEILAVPAAMRRKGRFPGPPLGLL